MEAWLETVIRQLIFYSLPVALSLTWVGMLEQQLTAEKSPHPFYAMSWKSAWWPLLIAIAMHRAVIIALPRPLQWTLRHAAIRCLAHALCAAAGFLLYQWALLHPPPTGLPPLHHWWAKVLMYFNLCMLTMHVLPMPGMLVGEWLQQHGYFPLWCYALLQQAQHFIWGILVALPLLDIICGQQIIYPIYEQLATLAAN